MHKSTQIELSKENKNIEETDCKMREKSLSVTHITDKQHLESINNFIPFGAHIAVLHVPSAR